MNMSEASSLCTPSEHIMANIRNLNIKEGDPSVYVESPEAEELYVTHSGSGSEYSIGIHKFGKQNVGPRNHAKEQHYVGAVLSRGRDTPLQDKLYVFYKEKNVDPDLDSSMWLPFVSQVCMADKGGPKSYLQFVWTSQLNARLLCGSHSSKQYYSELVDVATLRADRWQDTKIYALFRNEWGRSAVCVYTIQDIDRVFTTSSFMGKSGDIPSPRPGTCNGDSDTLSRDVLSIVKDHPEMTDGVNSLQPTIFTSRHHYTHIRLNSFQNKKNSNHTVLFLSLENGRVHEVLERKTEGFLIAEYKPFNQKTRIINMIFHPSTRKLYVSSSSELVQVDLESCARYGTHCEDCVMARDPYCGWNGSHCAPVTQEAVQDVEEGNQAACQSMSKHSKNKVSRSSSGKTRGEHGDDITSVPLNAKHFLKCPISSQHAKYTWDHNGHQMPCVPVEHQCLHLIDSMGHEQQGTYKCMSEERGYTRTLVKRELQLGNRAAVWAASQLVWVCLTSLAIRTLF
ncbi:semaphorin-4D [Polymixia lowei]